MPTFAEHILAFYRDMKFPERLPKGVVLLVPFRDPEVWNVMEQFYHKYFNDSGKRTLVLGINPGRLGAGATGINFTAPLQLEQYCGIRHPLGKQTELSAAYIYESIQAYGGVKPFYKKYFIGAVCPLGFTSKGVNVNYYDQPRLQEAVTPFIVESMERLLGYGFNRARCICIGEGKNLKFLQQLNQQQGWFQEIRSLPHPRFIMQYKRKLKETYLQQYVSLFRETDALR
jgi:hypothetical protein